MSRKIFRMSISIIIAATMVVLAFFPVSSILAQDEDFNPVPMFGGFGPNVPDEIVDLIFSIHHAADSYYYVELVDSKGKNIDLYHSYGYIEGSFFLTDPDWRVYTEKKLDEEVYTATLGIYDGIDENGNPIGDPYNETTLTFRIWEHEEEIVEVIDPKGTVPDDYPNEVVDQATIDGSNVCYHLYTTNSIDYSWRIPLVKEGFGPYKSLDGVIAEDDWYVFDYLDPGIYYPTIIVDLGPDLNEWWGEEHIFEIDETGNLVAQDEDLIEEIERLITVAECYGLPTDLLENAKLSTLIGDYQQAAKYIEDFKALLIQEIDAVINNFKKV